jgi:hypothetical protein
MSHKVFICHSSKDKLIADAACAALEAHRIPCWIAPRDIAPSAEWAGAIVDAITECQVVLLIFSQHANDSPDCRREINLSISEQKDLVPFRIENVLPTGAIKYAVSNRHWLDAVDPPMEHRLGELCDKIARLLNLPADADPLWATTARASEQAVPPVSPVAPTPSPAKPLWQSPKVVVPALVLAIAAIVALSLPKKSPPPQPPTPQPVAAVAQPIPDAPPTPQGLQDACSNGNAQSCVTLGNMYRTGNGVTADLSQAGRLYQQACAVGNQDGCTQSQALKAALTALNGSGSNSADDAAAREKAARKALEQ